MEAIEAPVKGPNAWLAATLPALLQRQVKHGLTDPAALAFLEAGFADRIVASVLEAAWPAVRERSGVRSVCRNNAGEVIAVLATYPSYFTVVANELGS